MPTRRDGADPAARSPLRSVVLVAVAVAFAGAANRPYGEGSWHVQGNRILDANGDEVRFSGVTFGGFESDNYALHGTWGGIGRNWKTYLDQIRLLGFDLIRVPFAGDTFTPGRIPRNVDYGANPELQGKTTLDFLDMLVDECGRRGIRIVLDYHRIQAGSGPENGLWYVPGSTTYTERHWIDTWKMLAARYAGNPTVVGADLFNEVHRGPDHPGPFWSADGVDEPYNWRTAAKRAAEEILSVNPGLLVSVQGMDEYAGVLGWWGSNLMGLRDHPFDVSRPTQVVYEVHDYGPDVYEQPWHDDPSFPANLEAFWHRTWGFVHDEGIGPVWVGEWGSKLDTPRERDWATALRSYISAKGLSWTWWTWAPTSADTGGILESDWVTPWPQKMELLGPILYPPFEGEEGTSAPAPRGGCGTPAPGLADPRHRGAARNGGIVLDSRHAAPRVAPDDPDPLGRRP